MSNLTATAVANANIAFIKYWGNINQFERIPVNGSISMNLDGLHARTTVTFDPALSSDQLILNGKQITDAGLTRVSKVLDRVRTLRGNSVGYAQVVSENNFPTGAGIASSAAAFSALALAASAAAELNLDEPALSRLARYGSGSACRSIPDGFVEWLPGSVDEDSYAVSIAPARHWALTDCVAIVAAGHKSVGSTQGHAIADSSPLQSARVADAPRRLSLCRTAILEKNFALLAEIVEQDSNLMHAVMMTSSPALFYWEPASLALMKIIPIWRAEGLPVFYTLDAGPNVHVLCPSEAAVQVAARLAAFPGVERVLSAQAGGPAHLV